MTGEEAFYWAMIFAVGMVFGSRIGQGFNFWKW